MCVCVCVCVCVCYQNKIQHSLDRTTHGLWCNVCLKHVGLGSILISEPLGHTPYADVGLYININKYNFKRTEPPNYILIKQKLPLETELFFYGP